MRPWSRLRQWIFVLIGGLVLAGTMGQGCLGGPFGDPPVTVELINTSGVEVDSFLWADPNLLSNPDDVAIPPNLVDVGGALLPEDLVTITLDCTIAGTLLADADFLPPGVTIPSPNLILLREGEHFLCGDVISFYYEPDTGDGFFISADVNDVTIAP